MTDYPEISPVHTESEIAAVRAKANSLGYELTTRCSACGAPIWADKSLRDHIGPVCASKNNNPGTHPAKNARAEVADTITEL
ncbi:hypothetical protein [Brevibacterium moorei]|uniref:hypothetical protein n=1 Tax=Brevibacterium moorei TaxID=2968457 RepID=UPI00211C91AA|nr:hypothetical protein [Brevibacterium sp. 68QC2CO]MCQ9386800.1 hypothetical protein [Brevibacterium sp. 68QC2CO]